MFRGMSEHATSSAAAPGLSEVGRIVRRHDPDRFLATLFAPPARRETLFVLYAVNHELARAREAVSNPTLALIRLQWWREVAEGARRRHEVAGPLGAALDDGRLQAADVLEMIEAREAEAYPVEDMAGFQSYVRGAFGGVMVAAGRALGAEGAALGTLRDFGAAYGMAGILRSAGAVARQDRCVLPLDLLASAGVALADLAGGVASDGMRRVATVLAGVGRGWIASGRATRLPRLAIPAALPVVLARRDLAHPGVARPRGLADRMAVMVAAVLGRV